MAPTSQELFARDAHHYFQTDLTPCERVLLEQIGTKWGSTVMLDLGVGAGRTAFTFGAICSRYTGIDYVPRMVELSRERVGETERRRFDAGDARDLSRFRDGEFDVVLFSFNGIDNISHDDRRRVLVEVRRVLRFHGGATRRYWKLKTANRAVDVAAVRARGWAELVSDAHRLEMHIYHVAPAEQQRQLRDAGFAEITILNSRGQPMTDAEAAVSRDDWLHFLCHIPAA